MTRLQRHSLPDNRVQDEISVYSGHDTTLTPLLLALELPVDQWPPFASRLIFELYKPSTDSSSVGYLVKVIFNGKDVTKRLKFCVSDVGWAQTGCALKDFINYCGTILVNLGHPTIGQACRI